MNRAQAQRMYEDVSFLTQLRPFRNYENLESLAGSGELFKGRAGTIEPRLL